MSSIILGSHANNPQRQRPAQSSRTSTSLREIIDCSSSLPLLSIYSSFNPVPIMTHTLFPSPSLIPATLRIPRCGNWLPEDTHILRTWLSSLTKHVKINAKPFHPVISEFQALIEGNAILYMLFHEMFDHILLCELYSRDIFGTPQVRHYKHMLQPFNEILTRAPAFNDSDHVGLPINPILD